LKKKLKKAILLAQQQKGLSDKKLNTLQQQLLILSSRLQKKEVEKETIHQQLSLENKELLRQLNEVGRKYTLDEIFKQIKRNKDELEYILHMKSSQKFHNAEPDQTLSELSTIHQNLNTLQTFQSNELKSFSGIRNTSSLHLSRFQ